MLPVDDRGLDIEPVARDEVLYATADPARAPAPVTLEAVADAPLVLYDAHYGNGDPTRRQLAERLQQIGRRLAPRIEVEYLAGALNLAARASATRSSRARRRRRAVPDGLHTAVREPLTTPGDRKQAVRCRRTASC